jgi:neutral amino acid transport system ATP-binding protein
MRPDADPLASLAEVRATPGVRKPDPILIMDNMTRSFGGLLAVSIDHLEIQRGTITALIGPNGAGKTTLFNLVSAFDEPTSGSWSLNGKQLRGMQSYQIARSGMVRTFQLTKSLAKMSCLENMMLAAPAQTGESFVSALIPARWRAQEREVQARAEDLLERFNLVHMRDEYAATLSGGQRKLLEMARSLMTEPDIILLDEPMAGVNPALVQSLLAHIEALRDDGMTVIFIEHDMDVIMGISDWIAVLAEGVVIAEGTPEQVGQNPAVIDAYLGTGTGID